MIRRRPAFRGKAEKRISGWEKPGECCQRGKSQAFQADENKEKAGKQKRTG
jgi:hypothetical protein